MVPVVSNRQGPAAAPGLD